MMCRHSCTPARWRSTSDRPCRRARGCCSPRSTGGVCSLTSPACPVFGHRLVNSSLTCSITMSSAGAPVCPRMASCPSAFTRVRRLGLAKPCFPLFIRNVQRQMICRPLPALCLWMAHARVRGVLHGGENSGGRVIESAIFNKRSTWLPTPRQAIVSRPALLNRRVIKAKQAPDPSDTINCIAASPRPSGCPMPAAPHRKAVAGCAAAVR